MGVRSLFLIAHEKMTRRNEDDDQTVTEDAVKEHDPSPVAAVLDPTHCAVFVVVVLVVVVC